MAIQRQWEWILVIPRMIEYPEVRQIRKFADVDDLYVCAMGFEDRSLGSNKDLAKFGYNAKNGLVLVYDVYRNENERNKEEFDDAVSNLCAKHRYMTYTTHDREAFTLKFKKWFKYVSRRRKVKSITVNISSLTKHALVWLVNFALENAERVQVIYTSPTDYMTQIEDERSFVSGVNKIFTLPEFSGAVLPGYSSLLVVFLGYDLVRPRGIFQQLQPSKKIGITTIPTTEHIRSIFDKIKSEHVKYFGPNDEFIECSIFDFKCVIQNLEQVREKHIETSNISIALTGSKLQTIAALVFAKKYKDVQLILSTPLEYHPSRYSIGVDKTWKLELSKTWLDRFMMPLNSAKAEIV